MQGIPLDTSVCHVLSDLRIAPSGGPLTCHGWSYNNEIISHG